MNTSFLKIIIAVFVVLAGIALLPTLFGKQKTSEVIDPKNVSVNLSGFTKDTVSEIRMTQSGTDVTLKPAGDHWTVGGDVADSDAIDALFADFSDMKIRDMVSKNEDNQAGFQVTKDAGLTLSITTSKETNVFYVGKPGPATDDFYIRKDGIKNVYLASGSLRSALVRKADDWKQKDDKKDAADSSASTVPQSVESK